MGDFTPADLGKITPALTDLAILAKRDDPYGQAKARHPNPRTGLTRNWSPIGAVWLNPEKDVPDNTEKLLAIE